MNTVQDLRYPKRVYAEVRINANGRATIINPPDELAETLKRAAEGVGEIGKANATDFYIEAPREPKARRDLSVRLAKRAIDLSAETAA